MNRRRSVAGATAVLIWTAIAPAPAQTPGKVWRIGVLGLGQPAPQDVVWTGFVDELVQRGYVEGRNLGFERRFAGGDLRRLEGLAAELAALKVDVIYSVSGTPGVLAVKKATTTIPTVMLVAADSVRSGIVASLARPGGNVTGNSTHGLELGVKRLQLLLDVVGKSARIAYLRHVRTRSGPFGSAYSAALTSAAKALGAQVRFVDVETEGELEPAFELMAREHADAVVIDSYGFFVANRAQVVALVARHRLPAIAEGRAYADAGLLVTYSVDLVHLARKAAEYVDKIFKGASPADLPVEQASKFDLVVNLKTAKALGITIPQAVLVRADEVIQ